MVSFDLPTSNNPESPEKKTSVTVVYIGFLKTCLWGIVLTELNDVEDSAFCEWHHFLERGSFQNYTKVQGRETNASIHFYLLLTIGVRTISFFGFCIMMAAL